jgi:hypothetical protein
VTELLDSPEKAVDLPKHEAVRLLARVGALAEVLRVAANASPRAERPEAGDDAMLTPAQAAQVAGLTVPQFYRRKAFRPAIVKAGHRTMRVSEKKLRRIMAGMVSVR